MLNIDELKRKISEINNEIGGVISKQIDDLYADMNEKKNRLNEIRGRINELIGQVNQKRQRLGGRLGPT